jgi:hypothetical protein
MLLHLPLRVAIRTTITTTTKQQKQEWQRKVIDVYGEQIEPICNYRSCKHKFSVHDTHKCKCRHTLNYAVGISLKIEP